MYNLVRQPYKWTKLLNILKNQDKKLPPGLRSSVLFTNYSRQVQFYGYVQSRSLFLTNVQCKKHKPRKSNLKILEENEDSDDDEHEEDEDEDDLVADGSTVKICNVTSLRADTILKKALNYKRKRFEECFYNNKIRFNGKILLKKAINVRPGDELDIIKGITNKNPELIEVSRVEILKLSPSDSDDERILVKLKKYKSLVINNYSGSHAWKESEPEPEA